MAPVLWHIEVSHYNEKVRWALDYKGIAYERRTPLPGLHGFSAMALTRSSHRRLPVLVLGGRTIADSTAIIAALEDYQPEPSLYPDEPEHRATALELEDFFDEELAPYVRRYIWQHTLGDTEAVVDSVLTDSGPGRKRAMRVLLPLARPIVRRDYAVSEAAAAEARGKIHAAMDLVESRLGGGDYLVGDRFSVADLTGAALFTPVLAPPEREFAPKRVAPEVQALREELEARPGGQWVAEMFARHRSRTAATTGRG
jgi:glutathione S-transferase